MQNSYAILGLDQSADESQIRKRYLELVKQYPPEQAPERAAEIRAAYDFLRDPIVRLSHQLFDTQSSQSLDSMVEEQIPELTSQRFPTEMLLMLGKS